jgi:hypothetical protein
MLALSLVVAAGIYAATAPDVIEMQAAYEHTKGAVTFTHQKHASEYKIGCGECHHDDQGKPLTNLKEGDPVKSCFDCHNKPGELKGKKAEGLSDKEKLAYHANALHQNCIDCHKQHNKETKTKAAPQTCKECHPKGGE